jgi:hypothetical protein
MSDTLREAAEIFRDVILNERGLISENGMTSDQINDVLNEFDKAFGAALAQPKAQEPAGWQPIETAPKDGTHIVATVLGKGGFGWFNGKRQDWANIVHWFEDGFYGSVYGSDQKEPFTFLTHWKPY